MESKFPQKIEKIIPYGKTRYKVLLSEGLVLIFYSSELKKLRLTEGGEISEAMYAEDILPVLSVRARERLVHILESSDKTEAELRRKLKESSYTQDAIDYAIEYCKAHNYIDDRRYAENYINYKAQNKSEKLIRQELMKRGISRDIIDELMAEATIDEASQIVEELKKRHYSPDMDDKEKQRIVGALARKGYSWNEISSAMKIEN